MFASYRPLFLILSAILISLLVPGLQAISPSQISSSTQDIVQTRIFRYGTGNGFGVVYQDDQYNTYYTLFPQNVTDRLSFTIVGFLSDAKGLSNGGFVIIATNFSAVTQTEGIIFDSNANIVSSFLFSENASGGGYTNPVNIVPTTNGFLWLASLQYKIVAKSFNFFGDTTGEYVVTNAYQYGYGPIDPYGIGLSNGSVVIAWIGTTLPWTIHFQTFSCSGIPLNAATAVQTQYLPGFNPALLELDNGQILLVSAITYNGYLAFTFINPDGSVGNNVLYNTGTDTSNGQHCWPLVNVLSNGNYAVVYQSMNTQLNLQIFNPNAQAVTSNIVVSTGAGLQQGGNAVMLFEDDTLVLSWESEGPTEGVSQAYAMRFDSSGNPVPLSHNPKTRYVVCDMKTLGCNDDEYKLEYIGEFEE